MPTRLTILFLLILSACNPAPGKEKAATAGLGFVINTPYIVR